MSSALLHTPLATSTTFVDGQGRLDYYDNFDYPTYRRYVDLVGPRADLLARLSGARVRAVVGNHEVLRPVAAAHGVPFHHVPFPARADDDERHRGGVEVRARRAVDEYFAGAAAPGRARGGPPAAEARA